MGTTVAKPPFVPRPPDPPEVIEARWQKKKEAIEHLANNIRRVRANVTRDLDSDDEKTAVTALAIALMDKTAERVGNTNSENEGHFGVTGFRKKHIAVIGNKIHLNYTGKAGVRQEKSFSDKRIAKALKKAIKNSPNGFVFTTTRGLRIKSGQVNTYLEDFGITSKDIRGYLANKFTVEKLNKIEPEETDKKRKKQLNKILKQVAERVGHTRATLKKHYLIPELPDAFINKSEIINIQELGYLKEGGEVGETEKEPTIYQSVGLEGYLVGKGENPYIGDEKEIKCSKNIKCFVSSHNDHRFIYVADAKNVAVLHVDKIDGHYTIRNMYTLEDYRRKGYVKKLYEEATEKLGKLEFSKNLSPAGKGFKEYVEIQMKQGGAILDKKTLKQVLSISIHDDIKAIAEWLHTSVDNIDFYFKEEPISLFESQIKEMESSYIEFPEEEKRTQNIYEILKNNGHPKPIFVELSDKDKFILEGRHRIVAFKWYGFKQVPVIYVKLKNKMAQGGTVLLAPNGKPSNLTPEQYKLVRTPEFKNWFGNWENNPENASKVVDKNGEPLVVYHGSTTDFNVFTKGEFGFHFAVSPQQSMERGDVLKPYFLKANRIFDIVSDLGNWEDFGMWKEYGNQFAENDDVWKELMEAQNIDEFKNKFRQHFDGIKYQNSFEGDTRFGMGKQEQDAYIIFSSAQAKLADGSNKTFNPNNSDIRMEEGGNFDNSGKISNFDKNVTKDEIQNVISGTGKVINGATIQATASYLRGSTGASSVAKESKHFKRQEEDRLKSYITQHNLWVSDTDFKNYLGEGVEQKVYLIDEKSVFKINDSIFYNSWEDYLHSLLLNNYFFPATAYELIGFTQHNDVLFAVVKQPFIKATEKTDLEVVKKFMAVNGFENTKNNDYYNQELGIILEDLHDENVLTRDGILYFVDTVFYISDKVNPNIQMQEGGAMELDRNTGYFIEDLQEMGFRVFETLDSSIIAGNQILEKINYLDSRYYLKQP